MRVFDYKKVIETKLYTQTQLLCRSLSRLIEGFVEYMNAFYFPSSYITALRHYQKFFIIHTHTHTHTAQYKIYSVLVRRRLLYV